MVAYIRQGKWETYLLPAFWVVLFFTALSLDVVEREFERVWGPTSRAARRSRAALWWGVGAVLLCLFLQRYDALDQSRNAEAVPWWQSTLMGGSPAAVQFCWRATQAVPRNTFVTLELRRENEDFSWQVNEPLMSQWYPSDAVPTGTEGLARVQMHLPLGMPPDRYTLSLIPYLMRENSKAQPWPGTPALDLGQVRVGQSPPFRRALLEDEVTPLVPVRAGPLALRAWRLSRLPVRPGDPIRLDLVWEVREQIREPLALAVQFRNLRGHVVTAPPRPR